MDNIIPMIREGLKKLADRYKEFFDDCEKDRERNDERYILGLMYVADIL